MKLTFTQYLKELDTICEIVYTDEDGNILTESSINVFKRVGKKINRYFRCTSGSKTGRLVSNPKSCFRAKSPFKVYHGKKVMRRKQPTISAKSRISKLSSMSKLVTKKNKIISKHQK